MDPYYLTFKAQSEGYHPEVILAGRRINDNMGKFVAEKTIKMMINSGSGVKNARVGVLGLTFKEDCPDLRNTRVVDIVEELKSYGVEVLVHDPMADPGEALAFYGIGLKDWADLKDLAALVVAVPHAWYRGMEISDFVSRLGEGGCLIDVKSMLDLDQVKETKVRFWRL